MSEQENIPVERRDEPQPLPRLLSLGPVTIDASWNLRDQTQRFYEEWIGLGPAGVHVEPMGTILLVFHNDGPDLLIRATDRPCIWGNKLRVVVEVPDLTAVRERLDQQKVEYQPMTGFSGVGQRIGLFDPSGNRLEIKRRFRGW